MNTNDTEDIDKIYALKEEGICAIRRLCDNKKYTKIKKLVQMSYVERPDKNKVISHVREFYDFTSIGSCYHDILKNKWYSNRIIDQVLDYSIQKEYIDMCLIFYNELVYNLKYFIRMIVKYRNIELLILILKYGHRNKFRNIDLIENFMREKDNGHNDIGLKVILLTYFPRIDRKSVV